MTASAATAGYKPKAKRLSGTCNREVCVDTGCGDQVNGDRVYLKGTGDDCHHDAAESAGGLLDGEPTSVPDGYSVLMTSSSIAICHHA